MAEAHTIQLSTGLPAGTLQFLSMSGREDLSRPYSYVVTAVAGPKSDVDLEALLGKPVEVSIAQPGHAKRVFHGLVGAAGTQGFVGRSPVITLKMVPWLWLATQGADVRIFQNKTVPEILKLIFAKYGGTVSEQLSGKFRKRAYCVQYRESDFDFASRLMEEEGIFYFFKHEAGKHTMVLGNAAAVHTPLFGLASLPYNDHWDANAPAAQVSEWHLRRRIETGKVVLRDHNFLRPASVFQFEASASRKHPHAQIEAYDYPSGLAPVADETEIGAWDTEGAPKARLRLDERQANFAACEGRTGSVHLATGARFKLERHPQAKHNGEYIVLAAKVEIEAPGAEALAGGAGLTYSATFAAFPAREAFRPERSTRKPVVAGPQTATVVGPAGEEIFTDKYGRVKVQFHWDREGKKDAGSSCFVRVAQSSAGAGFGMFVLPRIGHEVVVDFLEGDPDQPIIIGGVYNADNLPPYALPDQKTVLSLKSRSLKGGAADHNELRFDDAQGSEYLMLRAQKDRLDVVQNDLSTHIGSNESRTVGNDSALSIGRSLDTTVGKNVTHSVVEDMSLTVGMSLATTVGEAYNITVGTDHALDVGASSSTNVGQDVHLKAGANVGVEGGTNVHIKGGVNVVIEAGVQLTIKAGGSSVVLGPDGVSITGAMVKINSGGGPGSGSGAKPKKPKKAVAAKKSPALVDPLQGKHH